jgi:hypothetical protein
MCFIFLCNFFRNILSSVYVTVEIPAETHAGLHVKRHFVLYSLTRIWICRRIKTAWFINILSAILWLLLVEGHACTAKLIDAFSQNFVVKVPKNKLQHNFSLNRSCIRFWMVLTMVYDTRDYWSFGLQVSKQQSFVNWSISVTRWGGGRHLFC